MNHGQKVFVIDTNVFIHRPDAMMSFRDSEVVIPLWVLEELDHLKTYSDERARNARATIRLLDELGKKGSLADGVKMENGSLLRVALANGFHGHPRRAPVDILEDKNDNKIILTAYELAQDGKMVFFVSKDINARVKAAALGIRAVDYQKQTVHFDTLYQGFVVRALPTDQVERLVTEHRLEWNEAAFANQFVVCNGKRTGPLHDHQAGGHTPGPGIASDRPVAVGGSADDDVAAGQAGEGSAAGTVAAVGDHAATIPATIGRFDAGTGCLRYVEYDMPAVAGVRPLNPQQRMAFDLLLDPAISLVSLIGKAGTGKTLLAIAAGLNMVVEERQYARVLVSRPVIPMGKDIGYLPGNKDQKLSHWMQPLFDNLEYIMSVYKKHSFKNVEQLLATRVIELEALTYIRGRSLPGQFIIIDEAQNLSPHEVKTIVSRAGDGTKVVLTGDPQQIDSPYLDANSNGLSFLVEAFKGQDLFGHVTLEKSERSRLAELAAVLL